MPRTRKPQVARPAGRVASTTTWATKNVPSPMVYRIPTGRRDYSCEWKIVGSGVAPIHVRWIDEHEFQVSINEAELRGKIENWENLDLSNVEVTLSEVNWPVTITGSLNVEEWVFRADEWEITTLTSTTGTIETLTSTDATIANVTATSIATGTLETSSDVGIGWTLSVTWNTTIDSNLSVGWDETITWNSSVGWNSTITGNESIGWTLTVTWATTAWNITSSWTITTEDLIANWATTLWTVNAWDVAVSSLWVTNWVTVWTTLDVTGSTSVWGNLSVTGDATVGWATTFTWAVTAWNITSTGTATLNDVNVWWNETVAWTLSVTWNTTLNSALTVAWATTMSSNATVGGNFSVSGNSTVTGTSTTTWNAIFNNDVTISWDTSIAGNETIAGTLSVWDDLTLSEDLVVNWTTSLKSLETDGSVDIDGTLRVTGAINWGNGATITGQIESDTIRTWEVVADEVRVTDGVYLSANAEAPDFVLQSEKWQPNGVAALDENGKIDSSFLPPVYTTAIVKMGTWVFSNSNTAVVVDADITADSAVICTNYSDIVWDLNEVINIWQLTVVSNQVETGSFKYLIINPAS